MFHMLVVEVVVNPQVYLETVEQVVEVIKVKQGQLTLAVEVVVMMDQEEMRVDQVL
tara:strand:- start:64 stop:231 length:168 start_codon:yes stop_codon:yes gene_type:complete